MKALTSGELHASLKAAVVPLVRELQPEPVLLFGSLANSQPQKHSDVDSLMVVSKAPQPDGFYSRIGLVRKRLNWSKNLPSCDLNKAFEKALVELSLACGWPLKRTHNLLYPSDLAIHKFARFVNLRCTSPKSRSVYRGKVLGCRKAPHQLLG